MRNAQTKRLFAHLGALACGDDHAGIGHRDADNRNQLGKGVVVDAVVKVLGVNVVGRLNARHADGVRSHAVNRLQMLGMHEQTGKLVAVELQAKEHAQADVINAALHGAVHRLGVVGVVVLGSRGMQRFIALFVVGLLEEDIGADAGVVELFVVLDGGGGDIDVDAAPDSIASRL